MKILSPGTGGFGDRDFSSRSEGNILKQIKKINVKYEHIFFKRRAIILTLYITLLIECCGKQLYEEEKTLEIKKE